MSLIPNDRTASILSLLASSSTLVCCVLPSLLIMLGAGATFANFLMIFPFLAKLSEYKVAITTTAFLILLIAGYANYRTYFLPCPSDPMLGKACELSRRKNRLVYYFSAILFLSSTIFTYVIPRVF